MDQIEVLIKGFEARLEHRRKHPSLKSIELFYEAMITHYQRVAGVKRSGKLLAWVGALAPVELFYAMDIVPFMPELHAGIVASQFNPARYFDASGGFGLPVELCSAHRVMMGMYLSHELPTPDLIVNTSQVCDSGIKSFDTLSNLCDRPAFMLDQSRWFNDEGIKYYLKEIEKLVEFLQDLSGKKLDYNRLEEVLELSRQATEYLFEIGELRKAVPTPMRGRDVFRNFTLFRKMAGTKEAVAYLEALRDEVKEKVEKNEGAVPEERHRIYWAYVIPSFAVNIFDWMEEEHGAVIVMDLFTDVQEEKLDPTRPLESLAMKGFQHTLVRRLGGPSERAVEDVIKIAQSWKVDGLVFIANIGCKQGCALIRTLKDALWKKLELPTLIIDGDAIDPSSISVDGLKTKLEGFFEMLAEGR